MRCPLPAVFLAPSRLDELQKRYEENPRRFFAPLANEFRKGGDLDRAIAICEEHLEGQPANMNGHVVYGQALFDSGRYDDAETTFSTALGLDPENLIALRHLGDISRLTGRREAALQWYSRVLEADPRNDEILAFIAEVNASVVAEPPPQPLAEATPIIAQPAVALSEATTIDVTPRASPANATPIVPVESVPPPRPSAKLIDIDVDFSAGMDTPASSAPTPVAPTEPLGDIEFSDMSIGEPEPAAEPAPEPDAAQGGDDLQIDSALGWEMDGNINLDAEPVAVDGSNDAAPEVFVTVTMAELYLQQGLRDEALQVYRQLSELNPEDQSLRDRILSLERPVDVEPAADVEAAAEPAEPVAVGDLDFDIDTPAPDTAAVADLDFDLGAPAPDAIAAESAESTGMAITDIGVAEEHPASPVVAAPAAKSARSFFAALAQRKPLRRTAPDGVPAVAVPAAPSRAQSGPLDSLFGSAPDPADDAIGQALATAVGAVDSSAAIRGRPTQAAASELSLDSVFRSDSPERVSGSGSRPSALLKFDQFFSTDEEPKADAAPSDGPAPASADDAQFQSWLEGLTGKDKP